MRRGGDAGASAPNPAPTQPHPHTATPRIGFALLLALLAVIAGGKAVLFDTIDPDCFWHLRVAQQLKADGVGPLVDRLSFASVQEPWTPYSWLAELGMKAVWDAGGYRLAVAAQAGIQAAFVVLIALTCRRARPALPPRARFLPPVETLARWADGRPSYLACGVAAAAMGFVALPYLSFRPVTAALVLQAACGLLVVRDRARDERTALVWLVPVMTALLVNLHLNAVFVPAGFAALLAGAVWERFVVAEPPEQPEACRRVARCFLLTLASAAACCCTPMLPGLVRAALHYGSADPMVASGHLAEMRPFFHGTFGSAAAAVVGLTLVLIVRRLGQFRPGERLCLGLGVVLLSQWGRFAPVFALTAAPMLAVAVGRLSDRSLARLPVKLALATVLALATIRVAGDFPPAGRPLAAWVNRHGPDAPGYPVDAARYVADRVTPRTGRLIGEFTWGGYLEWRLGDRYQLLLDGRTQLFAPSFWRATYLGGEAERACFLARVDADAAVLPAGSSLFRHALIGQGWRSAWRDERSEVLLPPARVGDAPTPSESAQAKPKRWPIFSAILPE